MANYVSDTQAGGYNNTYGYGYDEYMCFHISDFAQDDCILVNLGTEKVRGIVTSVSTQNSKISYKTKTGNSTCHINDIVLLTEPAQGWISKK